jgi:hypothetical protein
MPFPVGLPEYDQGARILLSKLSDHGTVVMSVVTLVALSSCPLPFCIDCEFPNPWGHVSVWPKRRYLSGY